MKQNILNEIRNPLEEQRNTMVAQPKFIRDVKTKWIRTETQVKKYGLVFDKRALDETYLFKSYPYGFESMEETDLRNMNRLLF